MYDIALHYIIPYHIIWYHIISYDIRLYSIILCFLVLVFFRLRLFEISKAALQQALDNSTEQMAELITALTERGAESEAKEEEHEFTKT